MWQDFPPPLTGHPVPVINNGAEERECECHPGVLELLLVVDVKECDGRTVCELL